MYYSHPCSYCSKVFYTFNANKEEASKILFNGIKAHLIEYNEDHKENKFDEAPQMEVGQMFKTVTETNVVPEGGYQL